MKKEKQGREKIILSILIVVLILCIGTLSYMGIKSYKSHKENEQSEKQNFFDKFFGQFDDIHENIGSSFDNGNLEFFYAGTQGGFQTKEAIEETVKLNNKNQNIKVKFEDKDYDLDEIENIKKLIKEDYHYNIKFEYDKKKIVKMIIKKEITEEDIDMFNRDFELFYTGTIRGSSVKRLFDQIIETNRENDNHVTLNFLGKDYIEASEIRNLKSSIKDNFKEYEVYHEYDTQGFIIKSIVEEVK